MAFSHTEDNWETVPGTELLLVIDGRYATCNNAELVLVPEPSSQPNDPLNWSPTWKAIVIVNQAFFVLISILTPLAIAPLTPIFIQKFNKTLPQINMLFGAAAMSLGYANFILVPFSNIFGRRPTILICGLICVLANIWQARVTSYNSFIGARVVGGLGAAANESIMPMVITDVIFLHQRGLWMGLYFWAYFIGVNIGPIISGNIAAHISWRWFFWVCTIFQGVSLVMMVFMFPETRYIRPQHASSDPISQISLPVPNTASSSSSSTKNEDINIEATQQNTKSEEYNLGFATASLESPKPHIYASNTERPIGRPSKAQFSLLPTPHWEGSLLLFRDFLAPIQIFSFPIILWAAFSFGFAANCLLALNLTQSQVFAAQPYLFNPGQVGYVNFAFVVGGIVGLVTAGPFSDWVSLQAARRNGGIREAEARLWALVPYIGICVVGMTVAAVGYQRHWPWEVIVIIGYGFVGVEVIAIPAIVISYAVDCYKHIPGQIMVSGTIVKNTFAFGMIFFYNDWAVSDGFVPPVMTIMALAVGITTIGMVLFLFIGKRFRRATMGSKVHEL